MSKLKKNYTVLCILIFIFVCLGVFLYYIMNKDLNNVKVEKPTYDKIDTVVESVNENGEIVSKNVQIKSDFKVLTEINKSNVDVSGSKLTFVNDEGYMYSGIFTASPYIAMLNNNMNVRWINKVDIKKNGYYSIQQLVSFKNNIVSIGSCKNQNDYKLCLSIVNSKGKQEDFITFDKNAYKIESANVVDNKIIVVAQASDNNHYVYQIDAKYEVSDVITNFNEINGVTYSFKKYLGTTKNNDRVVIIVSSENDIYSITLNETTEVNKVVSVENLNNYYVMIKDGIYLYDTTMIKKYGLDGSTIGEYDIKNIVKDEIVQIMLINVTGDKVVVKYNANKLVRYMVLNTNLKMIKNIIVDDKYTYYDDMSDCNIFYINNKIYENSLYYDNDNRFAMINIYEVGE